MPLIGARELHARTIEVLRRAREEKTEYVVTCQGRPIAVLLPVDNDSVEATTLRAGEQAITGGWEIYSQLAEALHQAWPAEQQTQPLIDDIRRE